MTKSLNALVAVALFFLPLVGVGVANESSQRRPNVVIFLADDAGWGDYGHNGNKTASTPNIDRLAQSGASFDRFFVCPVCAPTRAEFLTGRYHLRSGVSGVSTGQERMSPREKTLADAFHAAGYATGAFGKWHNGSQWPYHPLARGFDEYYGYTSGHWGEYFDPPLDHNGKPVRAQGYIVDRCTDQAIDFIERHKDRPFLCYVPFTTPHSPWAVPNEYWAKYSQRSIEQPATVAANEKIEETRCVHAMLENQDGNVGRVLQKLRDAALEENTIVVYFSDNGPNGARWNGGMKGTKGSTDEGGIRSTCLIRYPNKIAAGTSIQPIAGAIDLLPTLTSLAGVQPIGTLHLDGRDLSPWLLGQKQRADDRMLFTAWGKNRSVRSQRYRLDAQGKLFDMISDPGQTKPIEKEFPEVAEKMMQGLERWNQEVMAEYESQVGQKWTPRIMDPRPISVGYRQFPRTWLPARDGVPLGNVERSASAPNSSYFVQWTSREDAVQWDVEILEDGLYQVELEYTCPLSDAGSTIEVAWGDEKIQGKVAPGWDPPLYTNQDTIPRPKAESKMKEFRTLSLGTIHLRKGRGPITIRAIDIPGKSVMHLSSLTLLLQ